MLIKEKHMKKTTALACISLISPVLSVFAATTAKHSSKTSPTRESHVSAAKAKSIYLNYDDIPDHLSLHTLHKHIQATKKPITFGVLGEFNYKRQNTGDNFTGNSESKFSVGALQFLSTARLADWLNATVQATYVNHPTTDGDHHILLDQAQISAGNTEDMPFAFIAGYGYLPFGTYHPYSLTGSLNKELEEAQNTLLALTYNEKHFNAELYFYGRGKKVNNQSRRLFPVGENFGVKSTYTWHGFHQGFQLTGGYINNFREVSVICNLRPQNLERVGALSAHMNYFYHKVGVMSDYTGTSKRFNSAAMTFNGKGAAPKALSGEGYVHINISSLPSVLGIGYGHSWDALALQMASHRVFTNYSILFNKHISMQLQYMVSHDYKTSDTGNMSRASGIAGITGTGKDKHTFQVQLSIGLGNEHPAGFSELTQGDF